MSGRSETGAPIESANGPSPARALLTAAVALVLLVAVVVVVAKSLSTTSARVSASTASDGFLSAGEVVLERSDDSTSLLFDADDLYPGREVRGCVELIYAGSVPAMVRLHADRNSGTGLDSYLDVRLTRLSGGSCEAPEGSPDDRSSGELYRGRLSSLWLDHPAYASGLEVVASASPGARLAVDIVAEVRDDNRAAGLTTEFVFTFEARPT